MVTPRMGFILQALVMSIPWAHRGHEGQVMWLTIWAMCICNYKEVNRGITS
jgi:hypothetical protein